MKYVGKTLHIKQGETFSFSGAVMDKSTATLYDTTGITARSQIRRATPARELIETLTCEWLAESVLMIYSADTTDWPFGNAVWDVQLVDENGQVRVTETVEVLIERYVTKDLP